MRGERGRERRQDPLTRLEHDHGGVARIHMPELLPHGAPCDLPHHARELAPRWPGTDDHEGESRVPLVRGLRRLRSLEREQEASADLRRILGPLQSWRERLPLRMPKIRVTRPGGQNQVVARNVQPVGAADHTAGGIDSMSVGEHDRGVALTAEDVADRARDLARRQRRGRDLIQQWLKDMMIGAIQDREFDVRAAQLARGGEATEARADDHDARPVSPGKRGQRPAVPLASGWTVSSLTRMRSPSTRTSNRSTE